MRRRRAARSRVRSLSTRSDGCLSGTVCTGAFMVNTAFSRGPSKPCPAVDVAAYEGNFAPRIPQRVEYRFVKMRQWLRRLGRCAWP